MKILLLILGLLPVALLAAEEKKAAADTEPAIPEVDAELEEETEYEPLPHPCTEVECGAGEECVLDDSDSPMCQCISECGEGGSHKVCSTTNETFSSTCELLRQKCLCVAGSKLCKDPAYSDIDVDYNHECKELATCNEDEAAQFPHRARTWFFDVMKELAEREALSGHYMKWVSEAEAEPRHWLLPAVWKYCDLDSMPGDNHVSHAELHGFVASLKMYEVCLIPFLDGCDTDDDNLISMHEWGVCVGMSEDESQKFENYCDDIRNNA